jgi:ADP-ribose pyrophosphatase YjhB (NUDIX family)
MSFWRRILRVASDLLSPTAEKVESFRQFVDHPQAAPEPEPDWKIDAIHGEDLGQKEPPDELLNDLPDPEPLVAASPSEEPSEASLLAWVDQQAEEAPEQHCTMYEDCASFDPNTFVEVDNSLTDEDIERINQEAVAEMYADEMKGQHCPVSPEPQEIPDPWGTDEADRRALEKMESRFEDRLREPAPKRDPDFDLFSGSKSSYGGTQTSFSGYTSFPKKEAAGGVVLHGIGPNEIDLIYVVRPTNEFGGYKWTLPKGKVEKGISPQDTAIREVREEVGLSARLLPDSYLGRFEGSTSFTDYYVLLRTGGSTTAHDAETEEVRLVTIDEAKKLFNKDRDREVVEKARQFVEKLKEKLGYT